MKTPLRILYSFPHKLGADRICNIAWQQVNGLAAAGADVLAFPGVLLRPVAANVKVRPTLAWGKLRIPYKVLGRMGACTLHDWIVSHRLSRLAGEIDIVHTWPLGAIRTLETARKLGITSVLERPNAHTRFAYEVVQRECQRLGVVMPPGHEHAFNAETLRHEEKEYSLADGLLCPSDFVARTFADEGYPPGKLVRHQYGFEEKIFYPGVQDAKNGGLTMLFAGGCAPRKGLHYALEAWIASRACEKGKFLIAGQFMPGYAEKLSGMLSHPSVQVLGFRKDVAELMRKSDLFILPSIEEGSALVTSEARGCGCVLVVSEVSGAVCRHEENALIHPVGDVKTLARHITRLHDNRDFLKRMRSESLASVNEITWTSAGEKLLAAYHRVIEAREKLK